MKTLKISEQTHKRLAMLKANIGEKSLDDTIASILDWWDWWKKPGPGRGKGDGYK